MDHNLTQWLQEEKTAAIINMSKERKRLALQMLFAFPCSVVVLFLIGYLSSMNDLSLGIRNIKYGIIIGVICEVIYLPFILRDTAKKYLKIIRKEFHSQLTTPGEEDAFASQVTDPSAIKIKHIRDKRYEEWIYITKDYLFKNYSFQNTCLIRLKDIDHIELTNENYQLQFRPKGVKTVFDLYPIHFYYRDSQKKRPDQTLVFSSPEHRDDVLKIISQS